MRAPFQALSALLLACMASTVASTCPSTNQSVPEGLEELASLVEGQGIRHPQEFLNCLRILQAARIDEDVASIIAINDLVKQGKAEEALDELGKDYSKVPGVAEAVENGKKQLEELDQSQAKGKFHATVSNGSRPTTTPSPGVDPSPSPSQSGASAGATSGDSDGNQCVDLEWLISSGFSQRDLVHSSGILADVLCVSHLPHLPCGTPHHALAVDGHSITSYRELCKVSACRKTRLFVNTVWAHHHQSRSGVLLQDGIRLYMHDTRYPFVVQMLLHAGLAIGRDLQDYFRSGRLGYSIAQCIPYVSLSGLLRRCHGLGDGDYF